MSKVIKIGGIIHAHFKFQGMNHSILKTSISSFIALVLVYYSVAWAVLRCSHEEDFANTEAAVSDASVHSTDLPYSERQGERISIAWDRIITRKRLARF